MDVNTIFFISILTKCFSKIALQENDNLFDFPKQFQIYLEVMRQFY